VEAIGTYSNTGHLCKKWTDLRRRITESSTRAPRLQQNDQKPRSKRFLTARDITDIVHKYEASDSTQQIGTHYGISKTRVAAVLREQGVTLRRRGLTDEQVAEAAIHYGDGRSLSWLGARYEVSHTTVAAALRRQGIQLRAPRLGFSPPTTSLANTALARFHQRCVRGRRPHQSASTPITQVMRNLRAVTPSPISSVTGQHT